MLLDLLLHAKQAPACTSDGACAPCHLGRRPERAKLVSPDVRTPAFSGLVEKLLASAVGTVCREVSERDEIAAIGLIERIARGQERAGRTPEVEERPVPDRGEAHDDDARAVLVECTFHRTQGHGWATGHPLHLALRPREDLRTPRGSATRSFDQPSGLVNTAEICERDGQICPHML